MTDANGNTSRHRYDPLGRLVQDTDPAGGSTTLSRTDTARGYQVIKTTALGSTNTYQTTFSSKEELVLRFSPTTRMAAWPASSTR